MKPTLAQMNQWFKEFNDIVFEGTLPKVPIKFTNTYRQLGQFYWGPTRGIGIKISLFYDRTEEQYRNCLLHEMCHLFCYKQGWVNEHHGHRWQLVAQKAANLTGLNIQRCETYHLEPAENNKAKVEAVVAKKNAPALLVDFDYGSYHFVVKCTKKVLWDASDGNQIKGYSNAKVKSVYICDSPRALRWSTSRSLNRGYKYDCFEYEREIKPMLDKAIKVDNLRKLCWWGEYDCLGIR